MPSALDVASNLNLADLSRTICSALTLRISWGKAGVLQFQAEHWSLHVSSVLSDQSLYKLWLKWKVTYNVFIGEEAPSPATKRQLSQCGSNWRQDGWPQLFWNVILLSWIIFYFHLVLGCVSIGLVLGVWHYQALLCFLKAVEFPGPADKRLMNRTKPKQKLAQLWTKPAMHCAVANLIPPKRVCGICHFTWLAALE